MPRKKGQKFPKPVTLFGKRIAHSFDLPPERKPFPENLRHLRKDVYRESQEEFAKRVGVSKPSISKYELGERHPTTKNLKKIADECDVSVEWLLGLSDDTEAMQNDVVVANYLGLDVASIMGIRRLPDSGDFDPEYGLDAPLKETLSEFISCSDLASFLTDFERFVSFTPSSFPNDAFWDSLKDAFEDVHGDASIEAKREWRKFENTLGDFDTFGNHKYEFMIALQEQKILKSLRQLREDIIRKRNMKDEQTADRLKEIEAANGTNYFTQMIEGENK